MVRILIVDDERIELNYLKSVFLRKSSRYEIVGMAENGANAVSIAKEQHPDVLLIDIKMPIQDGISAAQKIKSVYSDCVVILNTAYAEFEFARKALDYGFDAYLLKPASDEEILDKVESCLRKRNLCQSVCTVKPSGIEQAKQYIRDHLADKLYLSDIASQVFLSPTYFSRIFKDNEGISVSQYITSQRLDYAKILLATTEYSIKEISQMCGFSNLSHFNRCFRTATGMTPMQMRKR